MTDFYLNFIIFTAFLFVMFITRVIPIGFIAVVIYKLWMAITCSDCDPIKLEKEGFTLSKIRTKRFMNILLILLVFFMAYELLFGIITIPFLILGALWDASNDGTGGAFQYLIVGCIAYAIQVFISREFYYTGLEEFGMNNYVMAIGSILCAYAINIFILFCFLSNIH